MVVGFVTNNPHNDLLRGSARALEARGKGKESRAGWQAGKAGGLGAGGEVLLLGSNQTPQDQESLCIDPTGDTRAVTTCSVRENNQKP